MIDQNKSNESQNFDHASSLSSPKNMEKEGVQQSQLKFKSSSSQQDQGDQQKYKIRVRRHQKTGQLNNQQRVRQVIIVMIIVMVGILFFLLNLQLKKNDQNLKNLHSQTSHQVTLIFIAKGNQNDIQKSFSSFISKNTYPITATIIGVPFSFNKNVLSKHLSQNSKWVRFEGENPKVSKLSQILMQVKTQYYFYLSSQWIIIQDGFINYSIQLLEEFPKFTDVKIDSSEQRYSIFNPGVRRISDFRVLIEGYSTIVPPGSPLNQQTQSQISQFYQLRGHQEISSTKIYCQYLDKQQYLKQKQQQNINKENSDRKAGDTSGIVVSEDEEQEQKNLMRPVENLTKDQIQNMKKWEKSLNMANITKFELKQPLQDRPLQKKNEPEVQKIEKISNIQIIKNYKQLPFCLIVERKSAQIITQSVSTQNYRNYKIILSYLSNSDGQQAEPHNYYHYKQQIKEQCIQNSLIMFLNSPLKFGSLSYLNSLHQQYRIWVTFSRTQQSKQVYSFFYRIYELIEKNDFEGKNKKYLEANDQQVQTDIILQLCKEFTKVVNKQQILNGNIDPYFYSNQKNSINKDRKPYRKLIRLSQDIDQKIQFSEQSKKLKQRFKYPPDLLNYHHLVQAIERQDIWYLPKNHSIAQIQFAEFNKLYEIQKYSMKQKQFRFCVTVLSHNNVQNQRYLKFAKSLIEQEYQNYHIVFIDDCSTDATLELTKMYFNQMNFPKNRITFVKNIKRTFATYNIINAAFNFCKQDQIQLLLDGDDEIIGRYAFQVMNSAYQLNPQVWVAYSNYKSNLFQFGRSRGLKYQTDILHNNIRQFKSVMGPIRTWRVQLIYHIPLHYHKMKNGAWLDTVYDDALQHCLFEMAGLPRIKYVNEILYEYNRRYGGNDDSTQYKLLYRASVYKDVLSLTPLSKLNTLQNSIKDHEVLAELLEGKNDIYTVIDS